MSRAPVIVFFALSCFGPSLAQFQLRHDAAQQSWRLTNGVVEAVFQLTPEGTFLFREITDLSSSQKWLPPPGVAVSPIRIQTEEALLGPATRFRLLGHIAGPVARRGYRQTILLQDPQTPVEVRVELEMYENQPVLRHRVWLKNTQSRTLRIVGADMLPWSFEGRSRNYRSLRVNQGVEQGTQGNFQPLINLLRPGDRAVEALSGASWRHCAWLALRDDADRGLFFGWEFNGRAIGSFQRSADGALNLSAQIAELSHPLEPGAEFEVPAAFVGLYQGDWDEAGWRTQRFTEAVLAQPVSEAWIPPVVWNSRGHLTDINEHVLRREAAVAAALGVEVVGVDLRWPRMIGDWRADREKFPSGLRALSDYVHSLGMKFGLHFAPAEAVADAPVLVQNPDWAASDDSGYFGALPLCLGHRPAREWLVETAVRMIDDYAVDWILQDGENMVQRCEKTTHTHDPGDSNYANSVEGLDAAVAEIQRRRPRVLWENCQAGGDMMTFKMVQNYVTSIVAGNADPLGTRQAIFGALYPFPPRYAGRYMREEEPGRYQTRSHMFGGPWVLTNRLSLMAPEDLQFLADEIVVYKKLRARIRDGKVFRLTDWPAEDRTDALESYYEPDESAVVFAVRGQNLDSQPLLRLRGLKPELPYLVRFQEDRRMLTLTGDQLMRGGLVLSLPAMRTAEIVYIEPAGRR